MGLDPVISWTNEDFDILCPTCGEKYLHPGIIPDARIINTTVSPANKNCPELLRAVWVKDDYKEILYITGYPPKCFYCGFYITGYNVICIKNVKALKKKGKECGCRECKPFLYKRQR